jgi:hypothetical protein
MFQRDLGFPKTFLLLLTLLTLCLTGCQSGDSERTLVIHGAVHVYPTDTPPVVYPGHQFIEVLGPKDQVKIRQVLHRDGYLAVKIRIKDGREGWVFSGEPIDLR